MLFDITLIFILALPLVFHRMDRIIICLENEIRLLKFNEYESYEC